MFNAMELSIGSIADHAKPRQIAQYTTGDTAIPYRRLVLSFEGRPVGSFALALGPDFAVRTAGLRPAPLPSSCHPERSEGSAFRVFVSAPKTLHSKSRASALGLTLGRTKHREVRKQSPLE